MKISAKKALETDLRKLGDPHKALGLARFFKTGKGEYGEGDKFLGITVPAQRVVAKKYFTELSLSDIDQLLKSPVHELRFTALEALVMQYEQGTKAEKEKVYKFYLQHATRVNNWDLVDTSCREIVGEHLLTRPRKVLYKLAKSMNIWERRISIVSTYAFILEGQVLDTFALSDLLRQNTYTLAY
jgi:3-methyladenine DNA glycosylase AlkD